MARTASSSPSRPRSPVNGADGLRALVREQPWLSFAAAAGAGALLGGVAFSRVGRLAFAAAAGFVAHELWHREGRLAVDEVLDRFAPERGQRDSSAPASRAASFGDEAETARSSEPGPVQP